MTIAVTMTGFTGTVRVQASLEENPGSGWFDIELEDGEPTVDYSDCTGTEAFTVEGNYQWIRIMVCPALLNDGTFDKVSIRV